MDDEYQYNGDDYASYGQSYAPDSFMNDIMPQQNYDMSPVDWGNMPSMDYTPQEPNSMWGSGTNYGFSLDPNLNTNQYMPEQYGQSTMGFENMQNPQEAGVNWSGMVDKGLGALGSMFQGGRGGYSGSTVQNLGALLAGYMSDQRNKKTGAQAQQMIQQQSRPYDKVGTTGATMMGGSSMRDAAQIQQALAQQRLDKFRADPTSDAGYKAQMDQILEAKRRVAAARGVRFNPEAEQGALGAGTLAALAQNQMNYDKNYQNDRNSYFGPAGANMNGGLAEMLAAMQQQSRGDYYTGLTGGAGFTSSNGMNDPEFLARVLQAQQKLKG